MQLGSGVAVAIALIKLLAWESSYAEGAALKRQKTKDKKKKKERKKKKDTIITKNPR